MQQLYKVNATNISYTYIHINSATKLFLNSDTIVIWACNGSINKMHACHAITKSLTHWGQDNTLQTTFETCFGEWKYLIFC